MKETLWKNKLNFAKVEAMIYVHFHIIVVLGEKKNKRHYFYTAPHSTVKLRSQLHENETFCCVLCDNLPLSILHGFIVGFLKS
jgi:hypothetical protein